MSFNLDKLKTNEEKELEGSWEDIGDGGSILVARAGNERYNTEFRKIPKGKRRMLENGSLATKAQDTLICSLIAETVLLDWKGLDFGGKTIKYSKENAIKVLLELPEFRELVWELANDLQRFHDESVEGDVKNSQAGSDGN